MLKPRESYRGSELSAVSPYPQGQVVIEYVVLFAIVAALSIGLFFVVTGAPGAPGIFSRYVSAATVKMQ